MLVNKFFILMGLVFLTACGSSQCRMQENKNFFSEKTENLPQFKKDKVSDTGLGEGSTAWVKVYKRDGSKQCGMGTAVSPEDMSKDLRDLGIKIKAMRKQDDGLTRIQVCGSPTGLINVFEIQSSNVEKAESVGFEVFKN